MTHKTNRPFGAALAELLRETDYVTATGNVNWLAFSRLIPGFHYETLRKVVAGERTATPQLIEEVAQAAGIKPEYFAEYRLSQKRDEYDPRVVGIEGALANLATAEAARKRAA